MVEGATLELGSTRLMRERGIDLATLERETEALEHEGHTLSWLATGQPQQRLLGTLAFRDAAKPTAHGAIAALARRGMRAVMVTGDLEGAAKAIAPELGIGRCGPKCCPKRKPPSSPH